MEERVINVILTCLSLPLICLLVDYADKTDSSRSFRAVWLIWK